MFALVYCSHTPRANALDVHYTSDVVLKDTPWPRESSRTQICILGLGLGLDLECPGHGLSLAILA